MATPVTQNTFLSVYNDDYRDSDHYHRILFNNGRALQARELTQMQTIIQSELARLAGFIFKEGGIFDTSYGALSAGFNATNFVKVNSLPTGYDLLVGNEVSNAAGVRAIVKAVVPATGSDNNVLLVRYVTTNNLTAIDTTSPRTFNPSDVLSYDTGTISGTLNVQATNTTANPATGKGSMVEVPQFNTFVAGHLIMVEAQSLVLSKFNPRPTTIVGFKLTEEIITATDNIALYDNSGTTPNLTSPGADRYKITMTLTEQSKIIAGETFYPLYNVISGEAISIQNRDNLLSELGVILNNRTDNITGDFIVRKNNLGTFGLEVAEDSDDNFLQYKVSGGVAFIKGNRIEKSSNTNLRIAKPRNELTDITEKTSEFVSARYGNYFLAGEDSAFGLLGNITNLSTINLYNGRNIGGTVVGTARVRHLDKFDDEYRIHVFDVQMDSNGFGSKYSLATTRSVGSDSANYANLTPVDGRFDLIDRSDNTLLFALPNSRVQEITNVSMAVRRVYSSTTNGSGSATFSTGTSNIFTDQENWIVSVDSSGELFAPPSVSGTPNTSATITGLPTSSAVKLLGFETISAVRKTKTLNANQTQSVSLVNNRFTLSYTDIFRFNSVVDNTTNEDITYKFIFDNGQRDNFYTVGGGQLKNGVTAPAGSVTVNFDYFSHTSGDFFGGKPSYPDIAYEDVPSFTTSTGITYRLTDVIDMRPVQNNTGTGFTGTGAVIENIPKNTGLITIGTAKYWQPRVDTITISPSGQILSYLGETNITGKQSANIPNEDLPLHRISLNPYVLDTRDLLAERFSNLGYQMSDIQILERRISNLEEAVTLTQSELEVLQTTIPDPNDSTLPDRVKLGLTADNFKSNIQSAVYSENYRAMLARDFQALMPLSFIRDLPLKYDSDQSIGTVLKGSTVWPAYTEEVMINQNVASKAINVNQFEVSRSIGAGYIEPNIDTWTVRKKVDNKYQVESQESFITDRSISVSSQPTPIARTTSLNRSI
jgi:hypothetical protein